MRHDVSKQFKKLLEKTGLRQAWYTSGTHQLQLDITVREAYYFDKNA